MTVLSKFCWCGELQSQALGDDFALNLIGATVDWRGEGASHLLLHSVFTGVAISTHHLQCPEWAEIRALITGTQLEMILC